MGRLEYVIKAALRIWRCDNGANVAKTDNKVEGHQTLAALTRWKFVAKEKPE